MTSEQETAMYDQPSGVSREALWRLIDKERRGWQRMGSGDTMELVDAIFAVFEEAHAPANVNEPGKTDIPSAQMSLSGQIPTDDERKVLEDILDDTLQSLADTRAICYPLADAVLAAGFHRTVQGDPSSIEGKCLSCLGECGEGRHCCDNCEHALRENPEIDSEQGEPSDAAIEVEAWRRYPDVDTRTMLYDEAYTYGGKREGFMEGAEWMRTAVQEGETR